MISVVIPVHNGEQYIESTLRAVLVSRKWISEIIVVNDGSTDRTEKIVRKYLSDVSLITIEKSGANRARNVGFKKSKCDYIMFLDSDDILECNSLERLLSTIKPLDVVAGTFRYRILSKDLVKYKIIDFSQVLKTDTDFVRLWLSNWFVPPGAVLWKREIIEKLGGWDEELSANQDGDIMLRALISGAHFRLEDVLVLSYTKHERDTSISSGRTEKHLRSRMRVLFKIIDLLSSQSRFVLYQKEIGILFHHLAINYYKSSYEISMLSERYARKFSGINRISRTSISNKVIVLLFGLKFKIMIRKLLK